MGWFKKMWKLVKPRAKSFWETISPEMEKVGQVIWQIGIGILLPLAAEGIALAFEQKGLSGKERFEYAKNHVEEKAPQATAVAIVNAVRLMYTAETGQGSEY